jgi:hypothetical protein
MKNVFVSLFIILSLVIGVNVGSIVLFSILQSMKVELPTPN